jgi:acyl carrier protein
MPSRSDEEIRSALTAILREALRVPVEAIVPEARIIADFGAESIDILDIRFRIEEAFGFKIQTGEIVRSIGPDMSADDIRERFTVGSIAAFIRHKLDAEAAV